MGSVARPAPASPPPMTPAEARRHARDRARRPPDPEPRRPSGDVEPFRSWSTWASGFFRGGLFG